MTYKDNGPAGSDRVFTGIPNRGEKVLGPILHMVHRLSFKKSRVVSKAHNSCTFEGRNCREEVAQPKLRLRCEGIHSVAIEPMNGTYAIEMLADGSDEGVIQVKTVDPFTKYILYVASIIWRPQYGQSIKNIVEDIVRFIRPFLFPCR